MEKKKNSKWNVLKKEKWVGEQMANMKGTVEICQEKYHKKMENVQSDFDITLTWI